MDPKKNPYLAHHYRQEDSDDSDLAEDYGNGPVHGVSLGNDRPGPRPGPRPSTTATPAGVTTSTTDEGTMANFPRRATTAGMARAAEDGKNNPFTGRPFSKQYIKILKTRRDLPVHSQRYDSPLQCSLKHSFQRSNTFQG